MSWRSQRRRESTRKGDSRRPEWGADLPGGQEKERHRDSQRCARGTADDQGYEPSPKDHSLFWRHGPSCRSVRIHKSVSRRRTPPSVRITLSTPSFPAREWLTKRGLPRGLFVPPANSACVLFRVTKRFRAPLPDVYAWCTEFRDSDPELSRVRLRSRKVIRREGDLIEMEETGIMAFPFVARVLVPLQPADR